MKRTIALLACLPTLAASGADAQKKLAIYIGPLESGVADAAIEGSITDIRQELA